VIGTFLYFTRLAMVAAAADDTDARTAIFANIDLLTQIVTLVLQLVVTGHIMKRFGVSVALILLPIVVSLGFVGLAMAASFAVLILFEASFRAVQRAITRPARETLFTVVTREEKYKSKAFTDTFVYRGGDVVGAWTEGGLRALGLGLVGLASVAIPLAVLWAGLGLWLGRQQTRITQSRASTAGRIEPATAHAAPQSEPAG
jgi:AAA family ATP:ADP antiporter